MTSEFDPEGVAALSSRLGVCLVSGVSTLLLRRSADWARPYVLAWNKNFLASCYGDLAEQLAPGPRQGPALGHKHLQPQPTT